MSLPEVHLAGGTCAEALRLVPVALAMREQGLVNPVLLAAGPDPTAVARTYIACGLAADVTLPAATDLGAAIRRYDQLWAARTPAAVLVRGDNLGAALAAYWRRVPVMHMDPGRRSGSLVADDADANRRLLAQVATVHLAAAPLAAMNLLDERVVAGDVLLTGGTTIEAARLMASRPRRASRTRRASQRTAESRPTGPQADARATGPQADARAAGPQADARAAGPRAAETWAAETWAAQMRASESTAGGPTTDGATTDGPARGGSMAGRPMAGGAMVGRPMAGETPAGEARANRVIVAGVSAAFDEPVREAMLAIAAAQHDIDVIGGLSMPYPERSRLVAMADIVVTDDVDLAEEALAAGTAVLVPGDGGGLTEAIHAGSARQVDAEAGEIVAAATELLASRVRRDSMGIYGSPYGDGMAAARIAQATAALLGHGQFPDPMPARPEAGLPR
ncbi:UDP-N-acetylglucosamine 2-epimerase [Paractinoplanes globisporus]|uniref:UDP-N-acetylglucosamine 2-epimerase (non-hydrolyzing) n=1 Tax=Paractinoplanes globisporus TaxID=113565 RepID=A0ABW6WPY8_9ACTN|nr:UDP-N-acetylglucosamine 2-epimerase [Actinoplanes globisporus]